MDDHASSSRRSFLAAGGTVAATALGGCLTSGGSGSDTLKLGIIEDRSGNFALNGTPKYQASMLAIEELNEEGGILGNEIETFTPDPQSDNQRYQQLTRQAINEENVDALWAGYSSATRETIRPIIDQNEQLYFYTTQYEGGVCDSYTFCMGATARQQLGSVLPYMVENFGSDIYTIAADYNFGQLSADWVRVLADENDANVIGEEFIPLSVTDFGSTINNIQEADPDFVMALLVGANHTSFWSQRTSAGLDIPMGTSTVMAQGYQHKRLDAPAMANVYGGFNYMEEVPTDRNQEFVERFYEKFPDADYINEEAVNNYFSIKMYAQAAEAVGSTNQADIIEELENGMDISAPEGDISLQGPVHHMTHNMRVFRCDEEHNITVEDERKIPEQFLSETVGCDLTENEMTTQYTPADYYDEADTTQ
ncbi:MULTISPECIES: urea ABC transporter substrate-binding protein [Halobacterium]|uniref:urea ABC transporter substrate-binding protein n=1 Tax=Halobacterium TaxID=2239 RepID=UPI00073EDDF0|nr:MULTISPECIES: urea ABC transporter substrate-binding protein [Halobacterium]MCG1004715.1 urea ABC transporter substrate-binding protein [Halobacterium noricense]